MNMLPIITTEEERIMEIKRLEEHGWKFIEDQRETLYREFIFQDFNQAFGFMSRVALLAENIKHYPEWYNCDNIVNVTLSTRHADKVTGKDILIAQFINTASKSPCALIE